MDGETLFLNDTFHGQQNMMICSPLFLFLWYTVVVGILSILGLIGNTLSLIVLQRDNGGKVANLLLQALAIADNCVLIASIGILSIIYGSLPYFKAYDTLGRLVSPIRLYFQPIAYITKTCAIWMTVLLAVNRFVVIKKPLRAQDLCTLWKARLQVLGVVVFSIACNIPRFFHYKEITVQEGNMSKTKMTYTSIGVGSSAYIIYTNTFSVLILLLPMVILIITNVGLILELRKMRQQRKQLSTMATPNTSSDANITLVMIIIIVIFIVCHLPDGVAQGIGSFYKENWWTYSCYVDAACNFLVAFNSSINFFVYYFVRKRFRDTLSSLLCRRRNPIVIEPSTCVTETQLRYENFNLVNRLHGNGNVWVAINLANSLLSENLLESI